MALQTNASINSLYLTQVLLLSVSVSVCASVSVCVSVSVSLTPPPRSRGAEGKINKKKQFQNLQIHTKR